MIELPESITLAAQMNETLKDKTVADVKVEANPHRFAFYSEHKDIYPSMMKKEKITGAENRGGLVQLNLQNSFLFFSDGAYPKFVPNIEDMPNKHQLLICFEDKSAVSVSVQMYGGMNLYRYGECASPYYISSSQKPNALSDDFTFEYFTNIYDATPQKLSVKAFLATEQRIPGLGNGVLQDILFNAKFDPRIKISSLSNEDLKELYKSVKTTLAQIVSAGGRNTEKDFFGQNGGYVSILSKNTLGTPCPRCGGEIKKTAYMGGTVYFCEKCQRRS